MRSISFVVCALSVAGIVACAALAQKPQHSPQGSSRNTRFSFKTPMSDPEGYARYQEAMKPALEARRRADVLFRAGDLKGAEAAALETIRLSDRLSGLAPEMARDLIGRIRMKQGNYTDALKWLNYDWREGKDARLDLNIALCLVRLGQTEKAKRLYSDQAILGYWDGLTTQDLPGTRTAKSLEASILLARALNASLGLQDKEAWDDLKVADALIPNNVAISDLAASSLMGLKRSPEAEPYLRTVVRLGRQEMARDAQNHLDGIYGWKVSPLNPHRLPSTSAGPPPAQRP